MLKKFLSEKYRLTDREVQVLVHIVEGYTNQEIANKLNVSIHTVKAHISSLLNKFGVDSRIKLAVESVKEGFKNNIVI